MKKALRGFGIGLFVAGATLTLLMQFTDFQQSKDNDEVKRLQNQLRAAEQEIATLNEAVAQASTPTEEQTVDAEAPKEKATSEEQPASTSETKKDDQNKPVSKNKESADSKTSSGTILIYEGVSLYDIGKQAEDQGIVQNGRELELFLYKPEYARSLQKGQFELSSDMSLEEMARILTGKQ